MHAAEYPEVPPDFGHWLAGFIDGEGSFCLSPKRRGFRVFLTITLRADDRPILDEICSRTGLGVVRDCKRRAPHTPNANPAVSWQVWRKSDCLQVIRLLDRFQLRAKKARDYWATLRHRGDRRLDWTPMLQLRSQLLTGRAYDLEPEVIVVDDRPDPLF